METWKPQHDPFRFSCKSQQPETASESFSSSCQSQRCRNLHGLSKAEGAGNSSCFLHHWSSRDNGQCRILSLKSSLSLARCLQAGLVLEDKTVIPPQNMLADFFSTSLISLILLKSRPPPTVTSRKLEGKTTESENVGARGSAFKKMVKSYVGREPVIYTKWLGLPAMLWVTFNIEHLKFTTGLF